jgi:hypothetical protein
MAWQLLLRIGDTSAQDVPLTSAPCFVTGYPLNAPTVNQDAIESLGDGNTLSVPSWGNVVESIDLHIGGQGYTPTQVRDQVRAIERVLDLARQGSVGYLADKVYLVIQFDQDAEGWRSQILAANYQGDQAVDEIWKNYTTGTIALTRRFYWETASLHAVALTSGPTPTATTGYVTIYNADDTSATNQNWFQLDAAQVQGSLPAPARISIKNASAGTLKATSLYLGNYVFLNSATVDPIFRGNQSAGGFQPTTTEGEIAYWSLAGDNLTDAFRGQFGRMVVVYSDRPATTTLMRAAVQFRFPTPALDLALGDQHLDASQDFVMDLGGLPIPPSDNWVDSSTQLYLALKGRAASGTDSVAVAFIQIMPSTPGCYRKLQGLVSLQAAAGDEIIDDGPAGSVYGLSGANRQALYRPFFEPIHLWPGVLQRLRLIVSSGSFAMELNQAWQVKAEVRYRRLTL